MLLKNNQNRSQVADLTEDQDMFEKNSNKKINAVTASSGWSTFFSGSYLG